MRAKDFMDTQKKLLSFAVPCYNSESYMERCLQSLLTAGDEAEIIIIDDGSSDRTAEIADGYAVRYPNVVKVVHQENGGHGEGVNVGLKNAEGLYYKVVDSDDMLDPAALRVFINTVKEHLAADNAADLYIVNFIYDKETSHKKFVRNYKKNLPVNTFFTWEDVKRFQTSEMLLMHSIVYKTELLRASGTHLPKHTFYVDNIFSYKPLPFMQKLYYLDVDLYLYYIGREDQSVNLQNILKRYEQQIRVMKAMADAYSYDEICKQKKGLKRYMLHSLSIIMLLTQMFTSCGNDNRKKRKKDLKELWLYLKERDIKLYRHIRTRTYNALIAWMPFCMVRKVTWFFYRYYQRRLSCN